MKTSLVIMFVLGLAACAHDSDRPDTQAPGMNPPPAGGGYGSVAPSPGTGNNGTEGTSPSSKTDNPRADGGR